MKYVYKDPADRRGDWRRDHHCGPQEQGQQCLHTAGQRSRRTAQGKGGMAHLKTHHFWKIAALWRRIVKKGKNLIVFWNFVRFVPWDFFLHKSFCPVGRFVTWDVLSRGMFCRVGRFVWKPSKWVFIYYSLCCEIKKR